MAKITNIRLFILGEGTAFNCLTTKKDIRACHALGIPAKEEELCTRVVIVPNEQTNDWFSYTDHRWTADIQDLLPEWAPEFAPAYVPTAWLAKFREMDVLKLENLPIRIHFNQGAGQTPTHQKLLETVEGTKETAAMHLEWKIKDLQKQIEEIKAFKLEA